MEENYQASGAAEWGGVLPYVCEPVNIAKVIHLCQGLKLFFHQDKKENISLHECLSKQTGEIDIFIGP